MLLVQGNFSWGDFEMKLQKCYFFFTTFSTPLSPPRSFSWSREVPALSLGMWLCLPGGSCSGQGGTAASTKLCLLPLPLFLTLSWVRSQHHHAMVRWFELHGKWVFGLGPFFSWCTVFVSVVFSTHSNTRLLSGVNPAPASEMSNSYPEVYKFWMVLFWNGRWVVIK